MNEEKVKKGLALFFDGLEIDDPLFDPAISTDCVLEEWRDDFLVGYAQNPADILTGESFSGHDQMVLMTDIPFVSFCIHHFVPIHGVAHVAYIPGEKVTGLSRLIKLVNCYARRLQIQERMTEQITSALMTHLAPKGAACYLKADQFCVIARGVKTEAKTITTSFRGIFEEDNLFRRDFMELCR